MLQCVPCVSICKCVICICACLGGCCPCLSRPLVHWLQCLVAAVSLCVPVSGDKVASHVISLFCLSAQTPVFWLSCSPWDRVALPKEGRCSRDKNKNAYSHARPGRCWMCVYLFMHRRACLNLHDWVCVLSPVSLQYFGIAVSKAHSSQWDEPEKKGIHFYFYIILPKGMLI